MCTVISKVSGSKGAQHGSKKSPAPFGLPISHAAPWGASGTSYNKCAICQHHFLPLSSYREIFGDDVVEQMRFVNMDGCDSKGCRGGWSGRKVVANCIQPDERFMEIVRQGLLKQARLYWQREMGGISMQEHTAARVLAGQVDLRDAVNYVLDVDSMEKDRAEVVREISREV